MGYWYGSAHVQNGSSTNNYMVEMILRQNNSSTVEGIFNYYFKNTYRSIQLKGTYDAATRLISIQNIPITYFASPTDMEVDCMMDFTARLRVAKAGSNIQGRLVGKEAYKQTCPDITFDFKLDDDAGNRDSIAIAIREFKETYQYWTPASSDTLIAANIIQRPIVNYVVKNEYKKRENIVEKEIEVDSDSLNVFFYDNGEIDGDSISVFYNDQLLASSQKLSTKALHINIKLDASKEINEITMFADNLGSIPPNTALMLLYDGNKRYDIRLSSNLQKNATVRIKRKKS